MKSVIVDDPPSSGSKEKGYLKVVLEVHIPAPAGADNLGHMFRCVLLVG